MGLQGGSVVKSHLPLQEMRAWSLGQEGSMEEKMQPTLVFLPEKNPWTEEPGRL